MIRTALDQSRLMEWVGIGRGLFGAESDLKCMGNFRAWRTRYLFTRCRIRLVLFGLRA
jgi:hypothetical protein